MPATKNPPSRAEAAPKRRQASVSGRVRAPKLSVSLYQTDLDRLETIKTFMRSKGFRKLSDSEALRLACRHAVVNDSLVDLYQDMQQEDGRRKVAD